MTESEGSLIIVCSMASRKEDPNASMDSMIGNAKRALLTSFSTGKPFEIPDKDMV